jgi:hypothetical protein
MVRDFEAAEVYAGRLKEKIPHSRCIGALSAVLDPAR